MNQLIRSIFDILTFNQLTFESIKTLEINTSMLFNLYFAINIILSCFFPFFVIIDLYFLIPAAITQIFNHTEELTTPIGIPTEEAKVEIETHPVIVEVTISKRSI